MKKVVRLNRTLVILIITVLSVILSYIITKLVFFISGIEAHDETYKLTLFVTIVNPLIIAPIVTYKVVSLYYKVDELNEELGYINKHDDLTKIYNRNHLLELSNRALKRLENKDSDFAVFLMDYDYFKKVNDTFGHTVGDKVLIELANIVSSNIRDKDYFGRYGGEEFLLVSPNTTKKQAELLAKRLREKVNKSYKIENIELTMSVSIGVSVMNTNNDISISTLIKQADKALYSAKNNGRNRVEFFEE